MWKTIVLCASLFGSAALGLVTAARWVEPAALPAAGAIGLCLVGVVLILASPGSRAEASPVVQAVPATTMRSAFSHTAPRLDALNDGERVSTVMAATGPQPSLH
jgi:hypothetical protein